MKRRVSLLALADFMSILDRLRRTLLVGACLTGAAVATLAAAGGQLAEGTGTTAVFWNLSLGFSGPHSIEEVAQFISPSNQGNGGAISTEQAAVLGLPKARQSWPARSLSDRLGGTGAWTEPVIVLQPQNQISMPGGMVGFETLALWPEPFSYEWQFGGLPILHATNASLTLSDVTEANEGSYSALIRAGPWILSTRTAAFTVVDSFWPTAVGYVDKIAPPGCSLFATPFFLNGMSVTNLLVHVPEGVSVFKMDGNGFRANNYLGGWTDPTMQLIVGEAWFFKNPFPTNLTITLVGAVGHGGTNVMPAGYSAGASLVPQRAGLQSVLGFPADSGDRIYRFRPLDNRYLAYHYTNGSWSPEEPVLEVSEGFWAWKAAPASWIRLFAVNWEAPIHGEVLQIQNEIRSTVGQINFFTFPSESAGGRVYDLDGITGVGPDFVAQLYVGLNHAESDLVPVGRPAPFSTNEAAGYVRAGAVRLPDVAGGQTVHVQLRVWRPMDGTSYESAVRNGGPAGRSAIFPLIAHATVEAGEPGLPPPDANRFPSFRVDYAPYIATHPQSVAVPPGAPAAFSVLALGRPPMTYQWLFNGTPLARQTNHSLLVSQVRCEDAGAYQAVASNFGGSVTSQVAVLAVVEAQPPVLTYSSNVLVFTTNLAGATVDYPVSASDDCDANVDVVCEPPPGVWFPIGTNIVTCIATDDSGNRATCSFTVAVSYQHSVSSVAHASIPDDNTNGLTSRLTVSSPIASIADVDVFLTISNGWNGDLVAWLYHDSGQVALLNRVGRRAASPLGYGDSGFSVWLDDQAANGDIHGYRLRLLGSHEIPLAGPLTNAWAPDGRRTASASVLDTDPRTNLLDRFNVLNPNGTWTLWLADVAAGDISQLVSWGLRFSGPIGEAPSIVRPPQNQLVECGSPVTLSVTAAGSMPLSYQWWLDGSNAIADATGPALTLSNSIASGLYSVVVSNPLGSITSAVAAVVARDTTPPRLSCPAAISAGVGSSCQVPLPDVVALSEVHDTCDRFLLLSQQPPAGTWVAPGLHRITLTAMDHGGNSITGLTTFTLVDTNPPVVACPTNHYAALSAEETNRVVFYSSPVVREPCPTSIVCTPSSGAVFSIGQTRVDCIVTDASSNSAACSFLVTLNRAPTAGSDQLTALEGTPVSVSAEILLANDRDADGHPLSVSAVSPWSTNGGAVSLSTGRVRYSPVPGFDGQDVFTYTLSDALGGTDTGRVLVRVLDTDGVCFHHLTLAVMTSQQVVIRFAGVPGAQYTLQRCVDLAAWTDITTQRMPAKGLIEFLDPQRLPQTAFYRVMGSQ